MDHSAYDYCVYDPLDDFICLLALFNDNIIKTNILPTVKVLNIFRAQKGFLNTLHAPCFSLSEQANKVLGFGWLPTFCTPLTVTVSVRASQQATTCL